MSAWLRGLIDRGYNAQCGYDTDEAGERAAASMIAMHPSEAASRSLTDAIKDTDRAAAKRAFDATMQMTK